MGTANSEERQRLLKANTERIEYLFEQSLKDGMDRPVIFVFDIRDPGARMLAEAVAGKEDVKNHAALAEKQQVNFCLLYALSRPDAVHALSTAPSEGKSLLSQSFPPTVFPVVVYASGGILWVAHRIPQ
jgi:hypothetical protein